MSELLFFKPPNSASKFTRSGSIYPPLGLCQLAAMFPGEQVEILDAEAEDLDTESAKGRIARINPRVALLTASSFTLPLIEEWARWFKDQKIQVVVGGPHPTLLPRDFFQKCPSVDLAIRGEGELILPAIVKSLQDKAPFPDQACCWRTGTGEIRIGKVHRIQDFSNHPFPDFSNLDMTKYWCPDAKRRPMATMMTTRGCNNSCGFCSAPALHGKKTRGWSPQQILEELQRLHSCGIREVSFLDDGFTSNRERAIEICTGIRRLDLDLSWFCNARADSFDKELVSAMANAGCHQVYLGLESGSEQILSNARKNLNLDQMRRGVGLVREQGIGISAGFVIGLPGETDDTVLQSISLANELKPDRIQFSRYVPLPGSRLGKMVTGHTECNFHRKGRDQVGVWIEEAYRRCNKAGWGLPSW